MTSLEYLLPLISVLVGLSVADLATSLHRLLRARRRVAWDALPLVTALLAVLSVLDVWWSFYHVGDITWTFAGFFPFAASLIVLFLINAAALPDDVPPEGLDLRAFYEENGSYFWSLFALYVFIVTFNQVALRLVLVGGLPTGPALASFLLNLVPNLLTVALYVALARFKNRWFHAVALALVLTLQFLQWSGRSIGAA